MPDVMWEVGLSVEGINLRDSRWSIRKLSRAGWLVIWALGSLECLRVCGTSRQDADQYTGRRASSSGEWVSWPGFRIDHPSGAMHDKNLYAWL